MDSFNWEGENVYLRFRNCAVCVSMNDVEKDKIV